MDSTTHASACRIGSKTGRQVEHREYNRSSPPATVTPLYAHPLPQHPGFSLVALQVRFPPGGSTPPHTHGAASVSAWVQAGRVYNRMNEGPTMLLEAGDSFFEAPGCWHRTSGNASAAVGDGDGKKVSEHGIAPGEEAVIVANLVVETKTWEEGGVAAVVLIDEEYR